MSVGQVAGFGKNANHVRCRSQPAGYAINAAGRPVSRR